ncbi:MAG: hypothetical protein II855_05870 [Candidatus Methanomethylophilaceae archaeon]|nr:hypothetical protein [Candidatus Methanomethylophilaceae archaeon]
MSAGAPLRSEYPVSRILSSFPTASGSFLPSSYAVERRNLSYCEVFRRMMLLLNLTVFTMCLIRILFIAAYNT